MFKSFLMHTICMYGIKQFFLSNVKIIIICDLFPFIDTMMILWI